MTPNQTDTGAVAGVAETDICDCVPNEADPQPCRCEKSSNPFWRGYAAGLKAPRHAPGQPVPGVCDQTSGEIVGWQARDKVHGGAWVHVPSNRGNPDFEYRPLFTHQPNLLGRETVRAQVIEALKPFSRTGWMTSDTEHTSRTVVAHMHPEREREIILASEDFYRAARALAALQPSKENSG